MADEGGQEYRGGDHLRRKYGLGDQVRLFEKARRRALHGLAEEQPGQHSGEQPERIAPGPFTRRNLHLEAEVENERPAQQQHQRMDQAPDPAHRRADEALLEVAADELEQQRPTLYEVLQKQPAGESGSHGKAYNSILFNKLQGGKPLDKRLLELLHSRFAN